MADFSKYPPTMKAAQASAFGDPMKVLSISDSVPTPSLPPSKNHVVIKVHACSLSPSDYRMLLGHADIVKKPNTWPYIPGGDVAGVVVSTHATETAFKPGDRVMATWDAFGMGGIAEYTSAHTQYVTKLPSSSSSSFTFLKAAAMVDSGANAVQAIEKAQIKSTDKVLVLGGSGAVGSAIIEICNKVINVDTIVATSSDSQLVIDRLGADHCIDYASEKWYESDVINKLKPFDVVVDCAEGATAWEKCIECGVLKKSKVDDGRFLAVVINGWHIEMHSVWQLPGYFIHPVKRAFWSCWNSKSVPSYKFMLRSPDQERTAKYLQYVEQNEVDVVIDRNSPCEFTIDGIKEAFNTMINRKGHGKVVIKICDE